MQSMWTNDKGPICQLCWAAQYPGKAATEADYLRDTMAQMEYNQRCTIEAFKAATNTVMSSLVRKWEAEGTRCGEEGRNSDDAWDTDGDEWRERRAVYFECAEELKAAMRKFSSQNDERVHHYQRGRASITGWRL